MTEILESSLSIIVLAVIVSVRLVLYLRRRAGNRARRNQPPPSLDGIAAIEAEGRALKDDDDGEDFSAWALSVEAESREPLPPPRAVTFLPAVPPPAIPEPVPEPVFALDAGPYLPSAETAPAPAETRRMKAGGAFWEKLRDLPPLTQGIMLSEILGPPRGL